MGLNIKSILKAAAGVAAPLVAANPFGAAALAAVNHFLPEGEKLPEQATGAEVLARVEALPAEQRAAVFGQLIQADMNESDNFAANVQAMAEVDKVGGSTRPQIALLMAWYLVLTGGVLALALCLAVIDGVGSVQALAEVWPLVLAWMAPASGAAARLFRSAH